MCGVAALQISTVMWQGSRMLLQHSDLIDARVLLKQLVVAADW
jgi:hypothetical protein